MRSSILFLLTSIDFVVTKCPSPVSDDIGVSYDTSGRFNRIIEDVGNTLNTTFVHHRHGGEKYKYILTFCGEDKEFAVKQIDDKGTERKLGLHDSSSVLIGAEDWLLLQYKNGQKYGSHCNKQSKQAWISIRCEERGEKPQLRVIEEARFNHTHKGVHPDTICYFLFEYNHPAACSSRKKPMSGGAVFCIIIIVLAVAYFLFGFIYQRFVLRATGVEQIPHYSFWRKFGNSMADGCDFVCRSKEMSNSYKGITDDLDLESSDDDKDGLLPM